MKNENALSGSLADVLYHHVSPFSSQCASSQCSSSPSSPLPRSLTVFFPTTFILPVTFTMYYLTCALTPCSSSLHFLLPCSSSVLSPLHVLSDWVLLHVFCESFPRSPLSRCSNSLLSWLYFVAACKMQQLLIIQTLHCHSCMNVHVLTKGTYWIS